MISLAWRAAVRVPVEAETITPRAFLGRSVAEIEALPVLQGNATARLGDFFRVSGAADGAVRPRVFTELIRQVAELTEGGRKVVVVSSGAIAMGSHRLGWTHPGRSIPEKQAAAAVGQIALMERYRKGFARHGIEVAQILVTSMGLDDRERYLLMRGNAIKAFGLERFGIVQ